MSLASSKELQAATMGAEDHRTARWPAPPIAARSSPPEYSMTKSGFCYRSRSQSPAGDELVLRGYAARRAKGSVIATALAGIAHTLERTSLDVKLGVLGARNSDMISVMVELRHDWWIDGLWKDVERLDMGILEFRREAFGQRHPSTVRAMFEVARTRHQQGRLLDCQSTAIEVAEAQKEVLGEEHQSIIETKNLLGMVWIDLGEYGKAETIQKEVLTTNKKLYGPKHPRVL